MSKGYKRIILVTDCTKASTAAEQTALNLAKQNSSAVSVIDTLRPPSFTSKLLSNNANDLFDMVLANKQERLDKVAARFAEAGIKAEPKVLFGKSSIEIARHVLGQDADLVVRYMKGSRSRQLSMFGATARNLMRVCPCPLLLVGDKPILEPRILACVNAEHDFNENEAILTHAENLAGSKKENLLALYCWSFYGAEFLNDYVDEKTIKSYEEEAEHSYRGLYEQFLKKHDLSSFDQGVHMENGNPVDVIPQVCRHESIDVAVMSSASQNHPLQRLLGSTVEAVLDELPCSLLVVKPLGFKSPLKPSDSSVSVTPI